MRAFVATHDEDRALARAIQGGDRDALAKLVAREHSWLVRLARAIVRDAAVAEECVQDAWIAVIRALGSYEGRASLRTWMATVVLNRAKTVAVRSARTVAVASFDDVDDEESVDAPRFSRLGVWSDAPATWSDENPEALLRRREVLDAIGRGLDALPENQRAVLTLRDLEGWSSEEVCNALGVSESNQRVLLHRARSKIRAVLEGVLGPEPTP
jgi:RNA polymerase sigma-70 factor (ECF subfamily)